MTLYLETAGGFIPWAGQPIGDGDDAVRYPLHIEQLWSAEELAGIGLYLPAAADAVPEGKVVTGATVQRVEDAVKFVHTLADAPPTAVPQSITMRQARLALLSAGLLAQVEAAIDGLDEPDGTTARIEWEYAVEIRRDHALIASLAVILGLSEQQVDDLFISASGL